MEELQLATAIEIAEQINVNVRGVMNSLNKMIDNEVEKIKIKATPTSKITHSRGGFAFLWKIKGIKITEEQLQKYNEPSPGSPKIE